MSSSSPSVPESAQEEPEERSGTVLLVLMVAANVLFLLLLVPAQAMTELDRQITESNGEDPGSNGLLIWPGMLIVWGAAWLGFLVYALRSRLRSALTTFNLVAALWLVPVALLLVAHLAQA